MSLQWQSLVKTENLEQEGHIILVHALHVLVLQQICAKVVFWVRGDKVTKSGAISDNVRG